MSTNFDASAQEPEPTHFGPGADRQHEFITLRQAAEELPGLRSGKRVHPGTLHRWRLQGLQTIRLGGTVCTTRLWLRQFFDSRSRGGEPAPDVPRTPASRRRAIESADRELIAMGL